MMPLFIKVANAGVANIGTANVKEKRMLGKQL